MHIQVPYNDVSQVPLYDVTVHGSDSTMKRKETLEIIPLLKFWR